MSKIIVFNSLTLDGVMQAPGRTDEDVRGDFPYGGWATPYSDPEMGRAAAESGATAGGLLLGRRTYEDFYQIWPDRTDNPYTEVLNNSQKYVASRILKEPLPWMNSTLLKGNVPEAVAALKAQQDKDLVILGSGELIQTLMQHQLIDQYVLLIHPLILGTGRRLFREGSAYSALQLVDSKTTPKGVVIATYQQAQ
jgi:dihydrofolate reductase